MAALVDEGFICPVCMTDQRSPDNLASHFQAAHNEEPPDVLEQVKGLFGRAKAKAKMLFEDQLSITSNDSAEHHQSVTDRKNIGSGGYQQQFTPHLPPQEPGVTRRHTDLFKRVRDAHVDELVTKTNTLVIRLSKLTSDDLPTDENKRKTHEQKIVPWVDDSQVSHCKTCGKKFNIRRRRHHCRLCGEIICDKCSYLLSKNTANSISASVVRSRLTTPINPTKTVQSDADSSAGSLRLCEDCQILMDKYQEKLDQEFTKPDIVKLYEKMRGSMTVIENITPEYEKMAQSFWTGETTYSLEKAEGRRQELSKHFNNIQAVSKKIMTLGDDEGDSEVRLRKFIRSTALMFIQEHSSGLTKLPEPSELEILITQRDEQRRRKVEEELLQARKQEKRAQARQPQKRSIKPAVQPVSRDSVPEDRWKPDQVANKYVSTVDDPMVQQINIIKNYIKQATQAQKWDEVDMLEMNLKHLEDEYFRPQN